jgi:hypothetical protein
MMSIRNNVTMAWFLTQVCSLSEHRGSAGSREGSGKSKEDGEPVEDAGEDVHFVVEFTKALF